MEIDIKGHSGCSINIMRNNSQIYLEKSTSEISYIDRLYKQAEKQKSASKNLFKPFKIPKIESVEKNESSCRILMEYVNSKNFIEYFELSALQNIDYFIESLIKYIDSEVNNSILEEIQSQIVIDKFDNVKTVISKNINICDDYEVNDLISKSEFVFKKLPTIIKLPIGICHGDLTFSNILFNANDYYLIDFLDSFIESPLMDIVKIRQDSAYLWSVLMFEGKCDRVRLRIIIEKIDKELVAHFNGYEWYQNFYSAFQLMNFLRILQYAKDKRVVFYLKNIINQLL